MTDIELTSAIQNAFKAFDALKPGEGIDISLSKTYKADKAIMIDICKNYIDGKVAGDNHEYVLNDKYTVFKRLKLTVIPDSNYWMEKIKLLK